MLALPSGCHQAVNRHRLWLAWSGLTTAIMTWALPSNAVEDLEYVAEHLPEGAANHRLASLPLWGPTPESWSLSIQGAWSRNTAQSLSLSGPLSSLGLQFRLSPRWTLSAVGFYDRLQFSGENDRRPLEVRFARSTPLSLPADAAFARLGGTTTDAGVGIVLGYEMASGWLRDWRVTFGALAQRLALSDYTTRYRILSGASAGATGTVDYSANYNLLSGLIGLSRRFDRGDWGLTPHVLLAMPVVRRGVQGRITGDGFDISGDTANIGAGKHYGDPAIVFGFDFEYRPWRTWFDVGALLSQPVLEPMMHNGLSTSFLLSVGFRF